MKVVDSLGRRCREGVALCKEGVGTGMAFFWIRLIGGGEEGRSISTGKSRFLIAVFRRRYLHSYM